MKGKPRAKVTHFQNSNIKHKMKRLQIPQKLVNEKFYVHEKCYVHKIAAINLSKIYFLKNAKKTCKPNNRDLHRDLKKLYSKLYKKERRNYPEKVDLLKTSLESFEKQ